MKGFFLFFHAIDDPLFILNGILPSIGSAADEVKNAESSRTGTGNHTMQSAGLPRLSDKEIKSRKALLEFYNSRPDEAAKFVQRRVLKMDPNVSPLNMSSAQVAKAYQNFVSFVCEHNGGIVIAPAPLVLPQGEEVSPVVDYRDQCPHNLPRSPRDVLDE